MSWLILIAAAVVIIAVLVAVVVGTVSVVRARRPSQPSLAAPPTLPPGWYPDQSDPALMRWFDGANWTSGTAPRQS